MSRTLYYILLVLFGAASVAVVASRPKWVSDRNIFLENFVNHEFLNLLGVILAITLASVANIHLEFNKIEERYGQPGLSKSRANLKKSAYWLIGLFLTGVAVVTIKPLLDSGPTGEGIANMAAMLILLWHVLILISLTQLVFAIPPEFKKGEAPTPQSPPSPEEETPP
jgi:hypothetical protein